MQDKIPVEESATIQLFPHELRINNLQSTDIGEYTCQARNREGVVSITSKVIVAGPAVIIGPPRNVTKLEGDKVELTCDAKALPSNVTHRWFHNGHDVTTLSWLKTRTIIKRDGSLVINPSSAEDSGTFTCAVTNGIGPNDTASAFLSIECKYEEREGGSEREREVFS